MECSDKTKHIINKHCINSIYNEFKLKLRAINIITNNKSCSLNGLVEEAIKSNEITLAREIVLAIPDNQQSYRNEKNGLLDQIVQHLIAQNKLTEAKEIALEITSKKFRSSALLDILKYQVSQGKQLKILAEVKEIANIIPDELMRSYADKEIFRYLISNHHFEEENFS